MANKKNDLDGYLKRTDIFIENNEATWDIAANGQINGLYSGKFKFKCFLTPSEKLASGRMYRELLGPNALLATKHEDSLAYSLSQLKYRVLSGPPFWDSAVGVSGELGDIPDENILQVILEAAVTAELKYAALIEKKKEDAVAKAKKAAEQMLSGKKEKAKEEEDE